MIISKTKQNKCKIINNWVTVTIIPKDNNDNQ